MATDRAPRAPRRALRAAWRRLDRGLPLLVKVGVPSLIIAGLAGAFVGNYLTENTAAHFARAYQGQTSSLARVVAENYHDHPGDPYQMNAFLRGVVESTPMLDQVRVYRLSGGGRVLWVSAGDYGSAAEDRGSERAAEERLFPIGTPTDPAWVGILVSDRDLNVAVGDIRRDVLTVVAATCVVGLALWGVLLYTFVLRRTRRLSRAAKRVAAGDLSVRLPEGSLPRGRDALANVSREFDRMLRFVEARTRELGEAEARFRSLVERSPAAVYVRENDERWTASYVSPQMERMFGYEAERWVSEAGLRDGMIHPEDRGRVMSERRAAHRSGQPFRAEYRMVTKDDRVVWVRDEAELVPDAEGEARWQGILSDVTDRMDAQLALRRLDVQKQSVLDSAGEGIWGLGPDGRVIFVNPAAAQMTGWTPDELVGKGTHDLIHHTREDGTPYPEEECPIHAAISEGARHHVVGELFWRRDGSCFPVEYTSSPIFENGQVAGAVVVFSDVTERARADDTLREAYEREREAAERLRSVDVMKNAFLSAVSHELRTPLSAVLGFATTLQQTDMELEQDDRKIMLDRLAFNAHKLHQLLADLLDLDRTDRGILEPQRSVMDVADLVLRVTEEAELQGHPVSVEAEPVLAEVDGPKVERIVENLVTNAAKYTPEGTPVRVQVRKQEDGVLIAVEDEGPGIPESLKESVFQPFERGPDAPRRAAGTGIGLSLVARFAELHGGRAWVEDRPGGGSIFKVFLPGVGPVVEAQRATPAPAL